ncbi:MAG: PspA/IM30 family protein [Lachnospiraceae bacterium]|jgi:phage shock protein A|nr:PspA/IM30 family protein [Lachnospiraceae bacterium]
MGIVQRFKDIMSSNINALLDKAEDPEKMIDQYMRNLESDLGKVKAETASVMADETRCKRELDECNAEISKMQQYAEKAIVAGNDEDARQFLAQKGVLTSKQEALKQAYDLAAENAAKMKQMHDKLCSDIAQLNTRRDAIKAKVKVAKTQEKLNKIGASVDGARSNLSAFDRMEDKANKMLDEANAMAELNRQSGNSDMDALKSKYDSAPSSAVEDELAALKAKLGK